MTMTNISSQIGQRILENPLVQAFAQWAGLIRKPRGESCHDSAEHGEELSFLDRTPPQNDAVTKPAILVPVDFSPASLEAVKCGLNIARRAQGRLILLHAVNLNLAVNSPAARERLQAELCDEAAARTRNILISAQAAGISATCVVETGPPATVIARAAERCQAELIVLGKQPRNWFARLLGSRTVERVIREAVCPVMVLQTNG